MGENKAAINYIKGLELKKHIPYEVLGMVRQSVKEAGHEWNNDLIGRCCLSVNTQYHHCVLECDQVSFSHKGFLFGFGGMMLKSNMGLLGPKEIFISFIGIFITNEFNCSRFGKIKVFNLVKL